MRLKGLIDQIIQNILYQIHLFSSIALHFMWCAVFVCVATLIFQKFIFPTNFMPFTKRILYELQRDNCIDRQWPDNIFDLWIGWIWLFDWRCPYDSIQIDVPTNNWHFGWKSILKFYLFDTSISFNCCHKIEYNRFLKCLTLKLVDDYTDR